MLVLRSLRPGHISLSDYTGKIYNLIFYFAGKFASYRREFSRNYCLWSRSISIELFPLTFFKQFSRTNYQTRFDKFSILIFAKISTTSNIVIFPDPALPKFSDRHISK